MILGTSTSERHQRGQKRRVSVPTQLVTGPRVLYLDEPTSGLDSTASYEVMSFISEIGMEHKVSVSVRSLDAPSYG